MEITQIDTFGAQQTLKVGEVEYQIFSLSAAEKKLGAGIRRLPITHRVLLENLLRHEDGDTVTADDIRALAAWVDHPHSERGVSLNPTRVVLPDSSGVPMLADVAAMRDAMVRAVDTADGRAWVLANVGMATVTVSGTVKEFQYTNPHAWLILVVPTGTSGATNTWSFEMGELSSLTRAGIHKQDFAPGTKVTVTGRPMRDGRTAGAFTKAVRADGVEFTPRGVTKPS